MQDEVFQDPELDQVFMTDGSILEKIVEISDVKKSETVLEIGTGPGNLTEALARKCKRMITIEIDERLRPGLEKKFRKMKNTRIIWGNALDVLEKGKLRFDKIVANPPYAISEALVKILFTQKFKTAILTLPWKFVERIAANPEEDYYSRLSLFAQTFFKIETVLKVEKNAWTPRPDIMSFVVRLTPRDSKDKREIILREMALQDDKKLKNALMEALVKSERKTKRSARTSIDDIGLPKKILEKKISEMSLDEIQKVIGKF